MIKEINKNEVNVKKEIDGRKLLEDVEIVLFDLDSTVVDTIKSGIKRFKEVLVELKGEDVDLNFDDKDFSRWDQFNIWALERDIDKDTAAAFQNIWNEYNVMQEADPINGMVELIEKISQKKKEIAFPTSRPRDLEQLTLNWLSEKIQIESPLLYIRKENDTVDGLEFKASVVVKKAQEHFGKAMYIEDFPSHALYVLKKAKKEDVNVWVILAPYPNVSIDEELYQFDNLIMIQRDEDLGLTGLKDFLIKE